MNSGLALRVREHLHSARVARRGSWRDSEPCRPSLRVSPRAPPRGAAGLQRRRRHADDHGPGHHDEFDDDARPERGADDLGRDHEWADDDADERGDHPGFGRRHDLDDGRDDDDHRGDRHCDHSDDHRRGHEYDDDREHDRHDGGRELERQAVCVRPGQHQRLRHGRPADLHGRLRGLRAGALSAWPELLRRRLPGQAVRAEPGGVRGARPDQEVQCSGRRLRAAGRVRADAGVQPRGVHRAM